MPAPLADDGARRTAIAVHDRSFLVEAGAGSGKTAVMAARIALLLAGGLAPKAIAAVTFTELAASELVFRVRDVVAELAAGRLPVELRIALPDGLTPTQQANLQSAEARIDEITCSTIHGFCQRLIKPYPVEANIDPGAVVMDRDQADLAFVETTEAWLREELDREGGGLLAELVLRDPARTVALVSTVLGHMRGRRTLSVEAPPALEPLVMAFKEAARALSDFVRSAGTDEPGTTLIAEKFSGMAEAAALASPPTTPGELVALLLEQPHGDLCTGTGSFRAYQKKGKWADAAKRVGLSKAEGDRLNIQADGLNTACCETWSALLAGVGARVLADLVATVQPVLDRFQAGKRAGALLDFDDLIFAARDLLRSHEEVRRALARRYPCILVDEFQDTDPMQIEIFWRLCGEPAQGDADGWASWPIRPGALFLVGDPKQAIYRFRGADVAAYVRARDALAAQSDGAVLSISTNFRSCAPILGFVNERFEPLLSADRGQPGFTALDAFHPARDGGPCVAALDVAVADETGAASAEQQRDAEADGVADLCARLISSEPILDRRTGKPRPCRPGDIALLAPTGSELWRYEEALERRGVPVATQAGKGLFRRQEIQDLIAITRVLADPRDTLALFALLRGPLVGLSEEELLDIVAALPRDSQAPDDLPRLLIDVDPTQISHPHARDTLERLQTLRRQINATTPHNLLAQAIDGLRVRPILHNRHGGRAERALANVDLYLSFSRAFAVRGFRAFAETMTTAWTDQARAVEGRPDAQEEAVALFTMHAAKGLEWPIVVPINTMTQVISPEVAVTDRQSGRFYCPVFDVRPTGYAAARDAEKAELDRERVRLWYVAATRARELLVLPRLDLKPKTSAWVAVVELGLEQLPALDPSHLSPEVCLEEDASENLQTRSTFVAEAAAIAARKRRMVWRAPSRNEGSESSIGAVLEPAVMVADPDGGSSAVVDPPAVLGGRSRGLILHKLMEEVLTGETEETTDGLEARAHTLVETLVELRQVDPALGLSPLELSRCILDALALPEIAQLRSRLIPELPVYAAAQRNDEEEVTAGVVDAIALNNEGNPIIVVDWKSDVNPSPETMQHYQDQVRAYMELMDLSRGLIVLLTSRSVFAVERVLNRSTP